MLVMDHDRDGGRRACRTILDLRCGCCADHIENVLRSEPAIARAKVNSPNDLVRVEYDETAINGERIRELIAERGYRCGRRRDRRGSLGETPRSSATTRSWRRSTAAPSTTACSTSCRARPAEAEHEEVRTRRPATSTPAWSTTCPTPRWPRRMERDMRHRFFVALVLTIPVVRSTRRSPQLLRRSSCSTPSRAQLADAVALARRSSGRRAGSSSAAPTTSLRSRRAEHERADRHRRARRLPRSAC